MEQTMKVLAAINAVQAAMVMQGGISKDRKNQSQGYSFRGIDDVYNEFAPLLAKAHLLCIPSYSERQVIERESGNGKALFYVTVKGEFTFRSSEDGSEIKAGPFYGEAMDSGDKATNKAMSTSMKYCFMQMFVVPTEGDNDTENQTHEVKAKITPASGMFESQTLDMQNHLLDIAHRVSTLHKRGNIAGAWDEWSAAVHDLDEIQRAAAWNKLASNERSALKKESETRKHKEAA